MKRFTAPLLIVFLFTFQVFASADQLRQKLESMDAITEIEQLYSSYYAEKYVVKIKQLLNPKDSSAGTFTQRVIINHTGFDCPTVLVTEGYGASYALRDNYQEELSRLFHTNVITVEHRYFMDSAPTQPNWDYLTAENAAYDLHHITTLFKAIYPEKWISTGISKGGQTTLLYRAFFPDDVDFSVPYVAPWNKALEDGRHEDFLHRVGTKKERKQIETFQKTILKKRDEIIPFLDVYCKERGLEFSIPLNEVLDFMVLEYPFAFWQWGTSVSAIPSRASNTRMLFDHLIDVSNPDYFADNPIFYPFNIQAARELGYYGYDIEPLRDLLYIKSSKGYFNRVMLKGSVKIDYDTTLYYKVKSFWEQNDPKMIFIYGEIDPWTASRIPNLKGKKNLQIYIQPRGSHRTRIDTMPEAMRTKIINQINQWLAE